METAGVGVVVVYNENKVMLNILDSCSIFSVKKSCNIPFLRYH